jgi:MerR family transcriptional regulator, light-induced transcriptional regulator
MATSMEQLSQIGGWIRTYQRDTADSSSSFRYEGFTAPPLDAVRVRRNALLKTIVESEILPRLTGIRPPIPTIEAGPAAMDPDTEGFVRVLLTQEAITAVALIEALRKAGAAPAGLYLGIVSQAARSLGDLWQQDRCDFAQVTISMGHLQLVLRALSPYFQMDAVKRTETEKLLLIPAPCEQHTFGLLMLAEFFLREGWHVDGGPMTRSADAIDMVRHTWFDVAGFSIGSAARLDGLTQSIRAVRRASRNPNLRVMVGGPLFLVRPDLVALVGADFAAADAAGAVRQARLPAAPGC